MALATEAVGAQEVGEVHQEVVTVDEAHLVVGERPEVDEAAGLAQRADRK